MDAALAKLFLDNAGRCSRDALLVYMALRADIAEKRSPMCRLFHANNMLVSGLTHQELAQMTGISESNVGAAAGDLLRMGWIKNFKGCMQLGTVIGQFSAEWFAVHPGAVPAKPAGGLLAKAAEDAASKPLPVRPAVLSRELKDKILDDVTDGMCREDKLPSRAIQEFEDAYWEIFEERYPRNDCDDGRNVWANRYVQVRRTLALVGGTFPRYREVVRFCFNHWDVIRVQLGFGEGVMPTLSILGTKRVVLSLIEWLTSWETSRDIGKRKADPREFIVRKGKAKAAPADGTRRERRFEGVGEGTPDDVAWT